MNPGRNEYEHQPVLVAEIIKLLITDSSGSYIDLTAGLGGHMAALAGRLEADAKLFGIDKDKEALERAGENLKTLKQSVELKWSSYADIDSLMAEFGVAGFDGALLDLGLSSLQIDKAERGFSFSNDGPLDMRFDRDSEVSTAADLVNNLSERELTQIFREYGEERQSKFVAAGIVRERQEKMILTTSQLAKIVKSIIHPPYQIKSLARIFQALRIAVNSELEALKLAVPKIVECLKTGGRLAVISYHSLEDRIVKNCFRNLLGVCTCPPDFPVCVCGREAQIKLITKKPLYPTDAEISSNPRSRSARLRVVEKVV
ncbi:MAG: 16S rRNA (cytosine(1402)-N(4))-methyltransferase RsmH [candidate division Zixibacteria bacterium]|nr:16S rRNA (cytosine(1402)-N(4))-methyltransferase RsmH [candidate division Zixibacteria bacterium]